MANRAGTVMVAVVLGGALAAGILGGASCGDNEPSINTGGTGGRLAGFAGRGGTGGVAGTGVAGKGGVAGTGGGGGTATTNMSVYLMQLGGSQEVPMNNSNATAMVKVLLDRSTGAVTVTGTFSGLTTAATAAHIHGPAAVGGTAAVIMPLTVPAATSGDVSGTFNMSGTQMNDMIGGMTYVNIHSMTYPNGEIRAQIGP